MDYEKMSKVALIQSEKENTNEITTKEIKEMVRKTVELAGGLNFIKDGQSVVLKPNIISARTSTGQIAPMAMAMPYANAYKNEGKIIPKEANGITSDYRIAQELVEIIREMNPSGKLYIMESSGDGSTTRNLELMGYTKENFPKVDAIISLDDTGTKFRDTEGDGIIGVELKKNRLYTKMPKYMKNKYYFDKTYYNADVIISLTCLKNHQNVAYTGGIKNLGIGVMPQMIYRNSKHSNVNRGLAVDHSFYELSKFIHDYYVLKPADFVFVDGLQGLAYGPACQGAPNYEAAKMNMRCMMASRDVVANDTIGSLIVGADPSKIPYINTVAEDDFGENDLEKIVVVGNVRVDQIKKSFPRPKGLLGKIFKIPEIVIYEDYSAPKFSVSNVKVENGKLTADVNADSKVIKIEVYSDNKLIEVFNGKTKKINMNVDSDELYMIAYDKLLNASKVVLQK